MGLLEHCSTLQPVSASTEALHLHASTALREHWHAVPKLWQVLLLAAHLDLQLLGELVGVHVLL
jgi:hypothetical protein